MLEEPKKASHAERERGHAFLGQADFRSAVYFTELTHTQRLIGKMTSDSASRGG